MYSAYDMAIFFRIFQKTASGDQSFTFIFAKEIGSQAAVISQKQLLHVLAYCASYIPIHAAASLIVANMTAVGR